MLGDNTLISLALVAIEDVDLQRFAQQAYDHCVKWFGLPLDESWSYVLLNGTFDGCARSALLKEYTIVIRRTYVSSEPKKAAIAHEIYHRVTMLRKGLHRAVWIDEMLAFLAVQHILSAQGLLEYADFRLKHQCESQSILGLKNVQNVRRKRILLGLRGVTYPLGFGTAVACLGIELDNLLGWPTLCHLVQCQTWEEWFTILALEIQPQVKILLGIT